MQGLLPDLRYALRLLRKKKGFTAVAVLTLALGIGANAAIFTVVNAVVLQPLPYRDAGRLVRIWDSFPTIGFPKANSNAFEFVRLREGSQVLEQVATYGSGTATLTGDGTPERIVTGHVSSNLLDVLGVRPVLGRGFRPEEEDKSRADVVILGYDFWRRRFGGDADVVGRTITLDGRPCTVIGVMPAGFRTPLDLKSAARAELWRPLGLEPSAPLLAGAWQAHWLHVVGTLRPGRTVADAQADATRVVAAMRRDYPEFYRQGSYSTSSPLPCPKTSSATCGRPSCSSWLPSAWYCSLPAPTWRISCSPAPRAGRRSWPSARRWAPAGDRSSDS